MQRLIYRGPSNRVLVVIIGVLTACLVLAAIVLILLLTNSDPTEREDVRLCKTMWEHILYVAHGYERLGLFPDDAEEAAIVYVSETYDVDLRTLGVCIFILDDAGSPVNDLKPRKPS